MMGSAMKRIGTMQLSGSPISPEQPERSTAGIHRVCILVYD